MKLFFCKYCGKLVSKNNNRCLSCSHKEYFKNHKPTNYKGGNKRFKCNAKIMSINRIGQNNPMFGKHHSQKASDNMRKHRRGKLHYNWQGGKSSLQQMLRSTREYVSWRNSVYKRDNYTCKFCNQVGGNLEAHHIKPIRILIKEFLDNYKQYSIENDKEILLKLALNYKNFWEIDNGITVCVKCHPLKRNVKNNHAFSADYAIS